MVKGHDLSYTYDSAGEDFRFGVTSNVWSMVHAPVTLLSRAFYSPFGTLPPPP